MVDDDKMYFKREQMLGFLKFVIKNERTLAKNTDYVGVHGNRIAYSQSRGNMLKQKGNEIYPKDLEKNIWQEIGDH